MPRAPFIGIPCELEKHREFPVKDTHVLQTAYSDAILRAGGIPLMVPVLGDRGRQAELMECVHGVVLPGGDDVPPSRYEQAPHPTVRPMPGAQFDSWADLLNLALRDGKPLLAICAGIQVLNVALGGSLIQDIPSQTGSGVSHHSRKPWPDALHDVEVTPGTTLARILGRTYVNVNSAHHQALDRVADGLVVTARCPADGIIEAAELPGHPFLVAVQWHPERFFDGDSSSRLFGAFLEACRAR